MNTEHHQAKTANEPQLKRFTVTAWCDRPFYCHMEIEARSAAEALALAKDQVDDAPADSCDDRYLWDTFQVDDDTEGRENVLFEEPEPPALPKKVRDILETIARLKMDSEDGFDLTNDDAVDTLHDCIELARDALAEMPDTTAAGPAAHPKTLPLDSDNKNVQPPELELVDQNLIEVSFGNYSITMEQSEDGMQIRVYPITNGQTWDCPAKVFEIPTLEIAAMEEDGGE